MGKKGGGLYEKWLKHFTINVMTQSFHAFFLMFVMKMLSEIGKLEAASATELNGNDGILAIMSIVGMMAIIKFEKLFKQLFGLEDSLSGDLKGAGAKMFMGLKSANDLQSEIRKPFQKSSESRKRMNKLGQNIGLNKNGNGNGAGRLGQYVKTVGSTGGAAGASASSPLSDKTQNLYDKMKEAKASGNMDLYKDYRDHAATQMRNEKAAAASAGNVGAGNIGGGNYSSTVGGHGGPGQMTDSQKVAEYNDAVLENRKNNRKKWLQTAGTLASLSMGLGATDQISEAVTVANMINDPINAASNRFVDHGENITANRSTADARYEERTLSAAIKEGFRDATKNMRNDNGSLNPVKITVEGAKSYVTTPYTTVRNTAKASKVDNVDNI